MSGGPGLCDPVRDHRLQHPDPEAVGAVEVQLGDEGQSPVLVQRRGKSQKVGTGYQDGLDGRGFRIVQL